jgi:hypothetical protein
MHPQVANVHNFDSKHSQPQLVTIFSTTRHKLPKFVEMAHDFVVPLFVNYNTMQSHFGKSMYLGKAKHNLQTYKLH